MGNLKKSFIASNGMKLDIFQGQVMVKCHTKSAYVYMRLKRDMFWSIYKNLRNIGSKFRSAQRSRRHCDV